MIRSGSLKFGGQLGWMILILIGQGLAALADEKEFWSAYQEILRRGVVVWHFESVAGSFTTSALDFSRLRKNPDIKFLLDRQKENLSNRAEKIYGSGLFESSARTPAKKAFWINAYNFLTIAEVLEHSPKTNFREIGWRQNRFRVQGNPAFLSLDNIEHDLLRAMNDPRIHFAVQHASVGSPPLAREVFISEGLDRVLQKMTENALRHPLLARFEKEGGQKIYLRVSPMFLRYEKDFSVDPYGSAGGFLRAFVPAAVSLQAPFAADLPHDGDLFSPENVLARMDELSIHHPELGLRRKIEAP